MHGQAESWLLVGKDGNQTCRSGCIFHWRIGTKVKGATGGKSKEGLRKPDSKGPVETSQWRREEGRKSQLKRRCKGRKMGVDPVHSELGKSLV